MTNQVLGTATVLICTLGYVLAFRYFRKGQDIPAILLIMLCGLLLRTFTAGDLYLHEWDERYHALVAKNLIKHPLIPTLYDQPLLPYDYHHWNENHIWLHKQPLPLWAMAFSMKLFGINEIALRLPSIILSTIAIYMTFYIGSSLFNRTVGIVASFFHSINGLIIILTAGRTATDHFDLFHLFFIGLSIFFVVYYLKTRKRYVNMLIGVSIGLAILCKWLTALIALPVLFFLLRGKESRRILLFNFFIIGFFCLITFMPWQIYIHKVFPLEAKWESGYNIKHITETLDGHTGTMFSDFREMKNTFGELIYIPLLWFLFIALKNRRDERILTTFIWFMIPYLFFAVVKTKMRAYTLFAAPSVFIILGLFLDNTLHKISPTKYRRLIASFIFLIFLVPALLHSFKEIKPFKEVDRNPDWAIALRNLDKTIPEKNTVIFNAERPIETMFYSSFTAYAGMPSAEQFNDLTQRGYKVYIMGKGYCL